MKKLLLVLLVGLCPFLSYGVGAITGIFSLCVGTPAAFTCTPSGGVWTSSNPGVATIGSTTGYVMGVSAGVVTITYNAGSSGTAYQSVTINPSPSSIAGIMDMCVPATSTLYNATAGGSWSSSNPAVATIGASSGILNALSAGITTISYTLTTGCASTTTVTVRPAVAPITGPSTICTGAAIPYADATPGGTWTSTAPAIATAGSASGIVNGLSNGFTAIEYSLPYLGCFASMPVAVVTTPAPITGPTGICVGATVTLADATSGGTWTSTATGVATIGSSSGSMMGVWAGVTTISYTLPGGCAATSVVTVDPVPVVTGTGPMCAGATRTLTSSVGGTWTSGNPSIATVGSGSGIVTGVSMGTCTVSITTTAGCVTLVTVVVNPNPLPISGPASVCEGQTITETDPTAGGTWSCVGAIATIGSASGVVTGVTTGTTTLSYTLSSGCSVSRIITVNQAPAAITGATTFCLGASDTLTDATTGGSWTCGTTGFISIGTGGVVTSVAIGSDIVTYTLPGGCYTTATVNVVSCPLGAMAAKGEAVIQVYPSPAYDELVLEDANFMNTSFAITNETGRDMLSGHLKGTKTSVYVKEWPAGMYFVKVVREGSTVIRKFLKM